jgi:hypothetical protein
MVEQDQQPAEPILWVDAPLYVGKVWEQTVNYPGYGDYHFSSECEAEEEVTVPYGTFLCYRVRQFRTVGEDVREIVLWLCDGIGRVKFQIVTAGFQFELTNGETVIVPVFPSIPPAVTRLISACPNPFNPETTITYSLSQPKWASIGVYELTGRRVVLLANDTFAAGSHSVTWNGRDENGRAMPSGPYLVRLESASGVEARKVMLVK